MQYFKLFIFGQCFIISFKELMPSNEVSMVLHDSNIKLTANIGVCLNKQNLRTLHGLSGDALIRGLSFLHYFLKQNSNLKLILNFKDAEFLKLLASKADFIDTVLDQSKTNKHKVGLINDFLEKWYFKAQEITDVVLLYKLQELRNLLETQNPPPVITNDSLTKPINDFDQFCEFAKTWLSSIRGLEYTALKIDALFNENGEIYYDGQNPLLKEHNCPVIASLIN